MRIKAGSHLHYGTKKGGMRMLALLLCALLLLWTPLSILAETRTGGTLSGTVRVYLSSIGSCQSLDITIAGSYSIGGDTSKSLTRGEKISVSCQGSTLMLSRGGVTQSMGSTFKLRRHATSGENGVRIAQARNSANLYPGDIEFRARSGCVQVIVHVYIEDYMRGVLPYEMSDSFPLEALKAQAVAARTYTIKKMSAGASDYDVVDTTSDQTYRGTPSGNSNCVNAVEATKGIVGLYGGSYMVAYYTASNGGQTESVKNAWNSASYPYLTVKDDPYDLRNTASASRSATIYKSGSMNAQLDALLCTQAASQLAYSGYLSGGENVSIRSVENVEATDPKYASPSRLYTKVAFTLLVTATRGDGTRENVSTPITVTLNYFSQLESLLSLSLNSTQNELISIEETQNAFKIVARRYGHGIGMSQRGAQQMAKEGMSYEEILDFYYPGTTRVAYTFTRSILPALDGSGGDEDLGEDDTLDGEENEAVVTLQNPLETLNLRKEASMGSGILAQIPHGTQLRVFEILGDWCRVQYGALSGYVMCEYLTFSTSEEPEEPLPTPTPQPTPAATQTLGICTVRLTSGKLNLRARPNTASAVLALLPDGATLKQIGEVQNGWVQVEYGALIGYVSAQYVAIEASSGVLLPEVTPTPNIEDLATPEPDATPEPSTQEEKTDKAVVILSSETQTLNLRLLPTTASSVLARIRHGSQLQVIARYGAWSSVLYGNLSGYVMNEYLYFPGNFELPPEMDMTDGTPTPEVTPTPDETPAPEVTPAPDETPMPDEAPALEATPTPQPSELMATVSLTNTSSILNVRQGQSASSARLGGLTHDTQVRILDYGQEWCGIDYAGTIGYVATRYLRFESTDTSGTDNTTLMQEPTATPQAQNITAVEIRVSKYLNVRERPDTGARVLGRVRTGSIQTVTGQEAGFYQILFEGGAGYISAAYAVPVAWEEAQTSSAEATPTPVLEQHTPAPEATPTPQNEQPLAPEATPTPQNEQPLAPEATPTPQNEQTSIPEATSTPDATGDALPTAKPSQIINSGKTAYHADLYEVCGNENTALMEVPAGESVRVIEYAAEGWANVETQGIYGYMRLKDLSLRYEVAKVAGTSDVYSLYDDATYDAQVIKTLASGNYLSIIDISDEWAHVRIDGGKEGYILAEGIDTRD